jgi:hypothetical protein
MIRDDLSEQLIHLTRGEPDQAAADTFVKILGDRKLLGGAGLIRGHFPCVCFTEAPVAKLSQILAAPGVHGMRYKPSGIMVTKSWLFFRGGRPVIYQPDAEYDLLHESQKYRHVRYDGPNTASDHTWEREWRLRIDELPLDLDKATAVVPTRAWEEWFQEKHMAMVSRRAMVTHGLIGPRTVTKQPWHFIVLEDLGVSVPSVDPPRDGGG